MIDRAPGTTAASFSVSLMPLVSKERKGVPFSVAW